MLAITPRDFVQIREAAEILGVTEQTLRNWDRAGKLVASRHPINGYRIYRVADIHRLLRQVQPELGTQQLLDFGAAHAARAAEKERLDNPGEPRKLQRSHWRPEVALDPKHRPQLWTRPSSTVRSDWRKYPQEAHVLDESCTYYRRLRPPEIALLQGFNAGIVEIELTDRKKIAALGNAVPPPLAAALFHAISQSWSWKSRTAVEICAGMGGLAEGAASIGLDHLLLLDSSPDCGLFLKNKRSWRAEAVRVEDARKNDWHRLGSDIGLLSGGPPCQPWSQAGQHLGTNDERDLLSYMPDLLSVLKPEVFLFENVPGLAAAQNRAYLDSLFAQLRNPAPSLQYGVLGATFNAADFGAPQIRERVFILGFRDAATADVYRCFDKAAAAQTHSDPHDCPAHRRPWRTVGEAIGHLSDPGGWRRWIGAWKSPDGESSESN